MNRWSLVFLFSVSLANTYGTSLFVNGDFDDGNTGFTSAYSFVVGNSGDCYPEGTYAIGPSAQACHPAWPAAYPPAPGASPNAMIVNGATQAGVTIWSQTINVIPDTTYYFSFWVASNYANPAVFTLSVNSLQLGGTATATATLGTWTQFYGAWNSGSATSATASIINQNTVASGNDFSLDLLAFDVVAPVGATSTTPEPSTLGMLALGVTALAGRNWWRTRRRRFQA